LGYKNQSVVPAPANEKVSNTKVSNEPVKTKKISGKKKVKSTAKSGQ
jgi:hypothetical protein